MNCQLFILCSSVRVNSTKKQIIAARVAFFAPFVWSLTGFALHLLHQPAAPRHSNETIMKRIYSLLWALPVLLVSTLFLASCVYDPYYDEGQNYNPYYPNGGDRGRAMTVSGEWQGDFGMFYAVVNPLTGKSVQFDSRNSYVLFQPNYYGAAAGWGKQIDFYEYGPLSRRYHRFYWEIRNGVLYLTYPSDHNLDVAIYDYYLSNSTFRGRAGNSNFRFNLRSLIFSGWSAYTGDFFDYDNSAWNWNAYGYRGTSADDAPSVQTPLVVTSGRRAQP